MSWFALLFGFTPSLFAPITGFIAVQSFAWLCLWRFIRVVAATLALSRFLFKVGKKEIPHKLPKQANIFFFVSSYFFLSCLSDCSVRPPLRSQGGFKSSFFQHLGRTYLVPVSFFPPPLAVQGRGVEMEKKEEAHVWFSPPLPVMWLSSPLSLSLSSPLSGSIRSTSSSWPHCVAAVSLFNLSFPLPLQLALSFYPSLTPFLVYTQSVGLFVILLIPRSSPLSRFKKWKKASFSPCLSLSLFFFFESCLSDTVLESPWLCCWILKNVASVCSSTL